MLQIQESHLPTLPDSVLKMLLPSEDATLQEQSQKKLVQLTLVDFAGRIFLAELLKIVSGIIVMQGFQQ